MKVGLISLSHLSDISDQSAVDKGKEATSGADLPNQIESLFTLHLFLSIDWKDIPGCQADPDYLASEMWAPGLSFPV